MNKALKEIIKSLAEARKHLKRDPITLDEEMKNEYLAGASDASEILEAENAKLVAALENYEKQIMDFKQILKTRDKELATIEAMYNRAQRYIDEGGESETIISTTRHGKVIEQENFENLGEAEFFADHACLTGDCEHMKLRNCLVAAFNIGYLEASSIKSSHESLKRLDDTIIKQLQRANTFEIKLRDEREEKLVAALEKLDKYWFDGKAKEYACSLCDMGGAGYPTNSDGHDTDCIISEAHQLLAEYKKGRGE